MPVPMDREIETLAVLQDNYTYVVWSAERGEAFCIDPSEAAPVVRFLDGKGLALRHILITHHHWDHVGGVTELTERYHPEILGPSDRCDSLLTGGETLDLGGGCVEVIATPGHTLTSLCYYAPHLEALFSGDTLFTGGCGRLFEGSPQQMWTTLRTLARLPGETRVYCGHEYTVDNLRFALSVDENNDAVRRRLEWAREQRREGRPTVPSTIGEELATNPFLRVLDEEFRERWGEEEDVLFARLRKKKDSW